ncbi:uncharacterized protein PFLUO_LOCUS1201 [Penicillium psychrofluorescens]|uniref:uncharacterized protein n=1 Tax=Penicillium psychrofluorescens TaxID=3158075 RepID=UPI003CCE1153
MQHVESVAAHSFRVAMLAYLAPNDLNLDIFKCMKMGLFHDIGESVIGDIPTFIGFQEDKKYKMEQNGVQYLESLLQAYSPEKAAEMLSLWEEHEEGKTPEAQWVREMDKFECLLQAHEYEQRTYGEKNLDEFQGQVAKIHSQEGKRWMKVYQRERNAHLARRKHRVPIIFLAGDSNATNKVSEYLSKQFAITHISVDGILREKAKDQSYSHSKIIRLCIDEQLSVPVSLLAGLLEAEIEKFKQEKKSILISGFPKDREQLDEFERKIQKSNNVIFLADSNKDTAYVEPQLQSWKAPVKDFEADLERSAAYFEKAHMINFVKGAKK